MANGTKNFVVVACTIVMTVVCVGGVLLACGAVMDDVKDNKEGIKEVRKDVKLVSEAVSALKDNQHNNTIERVKLQKDISYIADDVKDIKVFMQKLDDKLELDHGETQSKKEKAGTSQEI
jgi:septal ring factor EnvC (AmiA/AmiB activator)